MSYADKLKQNSTKIQTNEKVLKEKVPVKKKAGRPKKEQEEIRNVAIPVALNQIEKEWIEQLCQKKSELKLSLLLGRE